MTATITGRVVTASGDGAGAVLSLHPLGTPRVSADAAGAVIVGAPIHVRADREGQIRLEALAGAYRLRLLVDGIDLATAAVDLVDGHSYELAVLLGLSADGGGAELAIVVAPDGLRLFVPEAMVAGDGLTYTVTDADAEGVGLIMIGD